MNEKAWREAKANRREAEVRAVGFLEALLGLGLIPELHRDRAHEIVANWHKGIELEKAACEEAA